MLFWICGIELSDLPRQEFRISTFLNRSWPSSDTSSMTNNISPRGDPSLSAQIVCHGRKLAVNENLLVALRYIRLVYSKYHRVRIWADAVCINQANFGERSAQVSMMHTIFARAHTVLAWIGEANAETGHATDEMWKAAVYFRQALGGTDGTQSEQSIESDSIDIRAITDGFLSRPFFGRLWVQRKSSFFTVSNCFEAAGAPPKH